MANQWIRLWNDMPNDPKWRTISKVSKKSISVVISIYIHLLASACNAVKRGETQCNAEDIASALDIEIEDVTAVLGAMQGRVLDGDILTGWEKRQPLREDNSSQRVNKYREKRQDLSINYPENEEINVSVTRCNAVKRNVTQCNAPDKIRGDKDKDKEIIISPNGDIDAQQTKNLSEKINTEKISHCPQEKIIELYHRILPSLQRVEKLSDRKKSNVRARWREHPDLQFWEEFFNDVAQTDFLLGGGNRGWQADFEWLINKEKFSEVLKGKYKKVFLNKGSPQQKTKDELRREKTIQDFNSIDLENWKKNET